MLFEKPYVTDVSVTGGNFYFEVGIPLTFPYRTKMTSPLVIAKAAFKSAKVGFIYRDYSLVIYSVNQKMTDSEQSEFLSIQQSDESAFLEKIKQERLARLVKIVDRFPTYNYAGMKRPVAVCFDRIYRWYETKALESQENKLISVFCEMAEYFQNNLIDIGIVEFIEPDSGAINGNYTERSKAWCYVVVKDDRVVNQLFYIPQGKYLGYSIREISERIGRPVFKVTGSVENFIEDLKKYQPIDYNNWAPKQFKRYREKI